jgi:hypothetical protein
MARAVKASVGCLLEIAAITGALVTIPLTLVMEEGGNSYRIDFVDWTIWGIFLAEFIFRAVGRPTFRPSGTRFGYTGYFLVSCTAIITRAGPSCTAVAGRPNFTFPARLQSCWCDGLGT